MSAVSKALPSKNVKICKLFIFLFYIYSLLTNFEEHDLVLNFHNSTEKMYKNMVILLGDSDELKCNYDYNDGLSTLFTSLRMTISFTKNISTFLLTFVTENVQLLCALDKFSN